MFADHIVGSFGQVLESMLRGKKVVDRNTEQVARMKLEKEVRIFSIWQPKRSTILDKN